MNDGTVFLLDELESKLKSHNWCFENTESLDLYTQGHKDLQEILHLVSEAKTAGLNDSAMKLYEKYKKEV